MSAITISGFKHWLSATVLSCLLFFAQQAQAVDCSSLPNGVLDGSVPGTVVPSQISVDRNCTIRNFPASNPLDTNFSFFTQPGQNPERWLIVFDNVVHTGQMSCNSVLEHKIWFTNGSSTAIQEGCQNLLIPVEKIDKQNPAGQNTAAIGVPFTYTLTMPVLFDPATGGVINTDGSLNDLHGVTLVDDLNTTGADLTYLSHVAYWKGSGAPAPHTFSNLGGVLTFDNFPIIPAGEQIVLEVTVVLGNTPANTIGTQFINTAKWNFGRLIDGVFYEPLPGEWGISPPMTIAGPNLVVTKTGPTTLGRTLNLGEWGDFAIDVRNAGLSDAWDVTILDQLPGGATGGMCDVTPEVQSARVFATDGVTPVAGKGPLIPGADFLLGYNGAPTCELTLNMLTAAAAIGPGERLIINYRTQLDADSQDGATLTNVAGAIEWFNGDSGNANRQTYTRTLSGGTVGASDHEDAHTVTVALFGYFFEKTVENLTTGVSPATIAAPGDTLRYTVRLQTTDGALNNFTFRDDLGAMNGFPVFAPGTLSLVAGTIPPTADTSGTNPNGGTNGAGILDVGNLSLPADSEVSIEFDITLNAAVIDGTFVTNQADLVGAVKLADSDDPNVNGQADPTVAGDEDPTRVVIQAVPPPALLKANTQATAAIGETFSYQITVPNAPHTAPLYDVRIVDDLTASAADLQYVGVTKISGSGPWAPVNTGTATSLVIEDLANGIDIPAGEQVVVEVTVVLTDTATNVAGLTFTNTAAYTYNQLDNDDLTELPGDPGTTGPMTIVEPELTLEKSGPPLMRLGLPGSFTLNVHNVGDGRAHGLTITDVLPNIAAGGMCDAAPTQVTAQLFLADGVTPVAPALSAGTDFAVNFAGDPACTLTLRMLTALAAIGADERLIVTYETSLDAGSLPDAALTNVAGATEWSSVATPSPDARTYPRALTNGTVGVLDHEDAYTVLVNNSRVMFEKTAYNVTTGDNPAMLARPGDVIRYTLRIENVGPVIDDFSLTDELDRLNGIARFAAGTLTVLSAPAGADTINTSSSGGAYGSGLLDVRNLTLGVGEVVLIEFEATLAPIITNGSYVANQSQLSTLGFVIANSDDPNVNGAADPDIVGDEDPTRILIESAPAFDVDKISSYLDGDPNVLMAGETLRYTITVQNIGTDHATDALLRDQIPANTTYVTGSTALNGVAVADDAGGLSPLANGLLINSPDTTSPGYLSADPTVVPSNVAVIEFDVEVYPDLLDGTVISNQAYVSAVGGGVVDQPSDDPRTPVVDDPTRDVVGNLPLLFAEKSAALQEDYNSPGVVDPADVLRYTIRVYNNGAVDATNVVLMDDVPANTTYVANTVTLNGEPVWQPDNGVFPLINGIPVSSADLTPPTPGVGEGTLTAAGFATVQFDLRVDDGVATGTLITNQAIVTSEELANQLTDGDGDPSTGPEPTVVVVGPAQQLAITKQVAVVGGGPAVAGATLEYLVRVRNVGVVPAIDVKITDDLDFPVADQLTFVAQSATLNGDPAGVVINGPVLNVDYGDLEPGAAILVRFQALLNANLPIGTTVTNRAVAYWNTTEQIYAEVSVDVGGVVGVGILSGTVWHDASFDNQLDTTERVLAGWTVELLRNDKLVHTIATAANGTYQINGLTPNYLSGDTLALVFTAPGAGASRALLGEAYAPDFSTGLQRIYDIIVQPGNNLLNLDLPIDPNGMVYDSVSRAPVSGATLTLVNAGGAVPVPASCLDDAAQQNQVTRADGYYKFDLNFSDAACPSGGTYDILVVEPVTGYTPGQSVIIPPDGAVTPFSVPACPTTPDDALPGTSEHCEVQASEFAPGTAVRARSAGTRYRVSQLIFDASIQPGSAQIFNNHIPLDPVLEGAVAITKTTPMVNITRGQLVPYTITLTNSYPIELQDVGVVDRFPPGFRYIEGSARVDGVPVEPIVGNRELVWENVTLSAEGQHSVQLLLGAGAGVSEGEYVNRAQAINTFGGNALSGEATATVRLVPDPTFDCTDVVGKVFDDDNRNGQQDLDERGLPGVRLVTARGLAASTDQHGRFHITCAVTPREDRGSNFVLKLDDRTLPSGFRNSKELVQIKRATRGKTLRFNFGASIHRVVGLEVADGVFVPDSTEIRPQWWHRFDLLLEELEKGSSILRLTYLADLEDPKLVDKRLRLVKKEIVGRWRALDGGYRLELEHDVFWRLGEPAKRAVKRAAGDLDE